MEKRNSLKLRCERCGRKRMGNLHSLFFSSPYQGILFGFVLIPSRRFRYFFLHWMCGTFFLEMETKHTVIIRGKGLTIVKPFISVTLFMCFMAAIIVSVRTVVAAAVIFIEIKWISQWMMSSSSLSSYSHSHSGHWNRPLRMNCISIWPKVTQELLFIAFHINQVLWYSHRQMCKTHWRRNCCGFFRSALISLSL